MAARAIPFERSFRKLLSASCYIKPACAWNGSACFSATRAGCAFMCPSYFCHPFWETVWETFSFQTVSIKPPPSYVAPHVLRPADGVSWDTLIPSSQRVRCSVRAPRWAEHHGSSRRLRLTVFTVGVKWSGAMFLCRLVS